MLEMLEIAEMLGKKQVLHGSESRSMNPQVYVMTPAPSIRHPDQYKSGRVRRRHRTHRGRVFACVCVSACACMCV